MQQSRLNCKDYYSFGMEMGGRAFNSNSYRCGQNEETRKAGEYTDSKSEQIDLLMAVIGISCSNGGNSAKGALGIVQYIKNGLQLAKDIYDNTPNIPSSDSKKTESSTIPYPYDSVRYNKKGDSATLFYTVDDSLIQQPLTKRQADGLMRNAKVVK